MPRIHEPLPEMASDAPTDLNSPPCRDRRSRRRPPWLGVSILAAALVAPAFGQAGPSSARDPSGPLVLELFTSQGCSSCPPADRLLSELGQRQDVVALSFHVDYWNYIGWRDPFSSPAFSERQRRYARQLAGGRVYTPQLVVDGRGECVGSDRLEAEALISAAREQPRHGRVRLSVRATVEDEIRVRAVGSLENGAPPSLDRLELWLAVFETGLETSVERGENARRTLHNDHVVRRFERLASASAATPADVGLEVALDPAWVAENLGVVAFLRDPATLAVHGAAVWRAPG